MSRQRKRPAAPPPPRRRQRRVEPRHAERLATQVCKVFEASWFLPAVLVVAGGLRLGHLVALRSSPFHTALQLDPRVYDEWGLRIAAGNWVADQVFFVDPLYAYFLAGLYGLFGHHLLVVRLAQLLLGIATCWLTARIGQRVFGSLALGNLAALLAAMFIPAVHYDTAIEKTALSVFLFTLALSFYLQPTARAAALSGLALGLAVLARGNLLLFAAAGAVALLLHGNDAGLALRRAALFAAGALAVVSLATAHNLAAGGELVLTTANLGQNLYIGQHRSNRLGNYRAPEFVRPDPRYEQADFQREAERRLGTKLGAAAVSSYWTEEALREIAAAPADALARTGRKLRLFWHQYETPDNDSIYLLADYSPVLRLPVLWMGVLFPLAVLGAITGWRRHRGVRVLAVTAALYCAAVIAFFVLARFRAPLVPLLAVLAAGGLAWLAEVAAAGAWQRLAAGGAVVSVAALFAVQYPPWLEEQQRRSLAIAYHNLGTGFAEGGNADAAIWAYERAVANDAKSVIASLRALGELYRQRGDYVRAEQHMRRVLAFEPQSRLGKAALVRLYETMRQDPRLRNDQSVRDKLAAAYGDVGRSEEAAALRSGAAPPR